MIRFSSVNKSSFNRSIEIQPFFSRAGNRHKNRSPYSNIQRHNGGSATKTLKPKVDLVGLDEKRQELMQTLKLTSKPIQTFPLDNIGGLSLEELTKLLDMGEGKRGKYRSLQLSFKIDGSTLTVKQNKDREVFGASQNLLKAAVQMAILATTFSQNIRFDFNLFEYTKGGGVSIHNDHGEVGMVVDVSNALAPNGKLINSRTGFYIEVPIGPEIYLIKVAERCSGESAIFPQTKRYSISAYKSYIRKDTEILKRERRWRFNDPVDDKMEREKVFDFINDNPELNVRCLHNADGDARIVMLLVAK